MRLNRTLSDAKPDSNSIFLIKARGKDSKKQGGGGGGGGGAKKGGVRADSIFINLIYTVNTRHNTIIYPDIVVQRDKEKHTHIIIIILTDNNKAPSHKNSHKK